MPERTYDVIIIGAGLAGLTGAALLARQGMKVLLLEKNTRLGGYATSYSSQGHSFDIATQALGGCDPNGPVSRILADLDAAGDVDFLPCEPARVYYFDAADKPYVQHGSWQAQLAVLSGLFPEHRDSLLACFEVWREIFNELQKIAALPPAKRAFGFTKHFPRLAKYGHATVRDFFDELRLPEKLQTLLAGRSSYCLLPLDRLSLVGFACTEMSYAEGAWMVRGGVKKLPEALAKSLQHLGGKIKTGMTVAAINCEGDRVVGVTTSQGEKFTGRRVVVACDPAKALRNWLPPDLIPQGYQRKLKKMTASGSYYVSYYRVPESAVAGMHPNIEVRNGLVGPKTRDFLPVYYLLVPSLVDKDSAPAGHHSLCLSVPLPPGMMLDKAAQKTIRQKLEKTVEKKFPALTGKLSRLFELSPVQLAAMTGNPYGSAYGWSLVPEQTGIYRLNNRTPLPNLYLAGHWTMPGGGIAGVMTSGQLCAQAISEDLDQNQ